MSVCFGCLNMLGQSADPDILSTMDAVAKDYGPDGGGVYVNGQIGLGSRLLHITPEDQFEQQPWHTSGIALVARVRLDNRAELFEALNLIDRRELSDSALIAAAYRQWGDQCVERLQGDWAFALWDDVRQRLLVARDATGNTALYWWLANGLFLFSTTIKAILAHPVVPRRPNSIFVGSILTGLTLDGVLDATAYDGVKRLLPGHFIHVVDGKVHVRRWWRPEELAPLEMPTLDDYYSSFLEIYEEAVAQCLRIHHGGVAVTLSGGLDSGSVAALAAPRLLQQGQALKAYVHTPMYDPVGAGKNRIGNEFPLAALTAKHVGNINPVALKSQNVSVLQGIRQDIQIHDSPNLSAANSYWINDLLQTARSDGVRVLLTGQSGNATVSYGGNGDLWPQIRQGCIGDVRDALVTDVAGPWLALKRRIIKPALQPILQEWHKWRYGLPYPVMGMEFASTGFRSELEGSRSLVQEGEQLNRWRLGMLRGGQGAGNWMELSAHYSLAVRDPTRNRRVMEFCWRLPDSTFWARGVQRGLIRNGMRDHLPREVLYAKSKGLQSADLGARLRAQRTEVLDALAQFKSNALCHDWLNLNRMRQSLDFLEHGSVPAKTMEESTVLARSLSVGLFLLKF